MIERSTHTKSPGRSSDLFVSNHAMMVRIRGGFSAWDLQKALDGIRFRHTALIPGAMLNDPFISHFQVREIVECTKSDWKEIVKEELLKPFLSEQGPFARFILLRSEGGSDLVGVFHHGICDGISGVYVMRDILRLLAAPEISLATIPSPLNIQTLIPLTVRESPRVQRQVRMFLIVIRLGLFFRRLRAHVFLVPDRNRSRENVDTETQPASQRICILTETMTTEQTAALVARCKTEGTSIHAAMCVAWLRAFAIQLEGQKSWVRIVSSPISLRERLSIPEISGLFMATTVIKINCAPRRDFWQISREFKRKLNQASTDENVFRFPLMIGAVFSQIPKKYLKDILPTLFNRPVKYDFSITNLGRVDLPVSNGKFEVEAFYNMVNTSEHERTICVNTFNGQLTYSYLFRESKMNYSAAQSLMDLVKEQLSKAVVR